jgi:NitT/TauT family transport system substrate-binding protein
VKLADNSVRIEPLGPGHELRQHANVATLTNRKDARRASTAPAKETVDWMYSDPAALKIYAEFSGLPDTIVRKVRELMPKDSMATDRIVGVDQIMAEAVQNKFLAAPLSKEQVAELIRTGDLQ